METCFFFFKSLYNKSMKKFFFVLFIFLPFFLSGQESAVHINEAYLPVIKKLSSSDVVFRQFQELVRYNDKIYADDLKDNSTNEEIEFYLYRPKQGEDILSVSAASGIPYDTLASLNSLRDMSSKIEGKKIVLPTVKGLYVSDRPESSVEILIHEEYKSFVANCKEMCYILGNKKFYFLSGKRFTPTQRAYFLDINIRMPLDHIQVTSSFGYRDSPVYHNWKFHRGIDFAAQTGSCVYACKGGSVALCVAMDSVFGNYIVLSHNNGLSSVYAHLSKINVKKGDIVRSGDIIGLTGDTGAVTGPHLHFEIRQDGVAVDPSDFLKF